MLNNGATNPATFDNVLKRIHGLIRHSEDPQVKRAAGIAAQEIKKTQLKTK